MVFVAIFTRSKSRELGERKRLGFLREIVGVETSFVLESVTDQIVFGSFPSPYVH
jgi:hypothetical protein